MQPFGPPGYGRRHGGERYAEQIGEPLDTSPYKVVGRRPIVVIDKSMGGARVSDEAIVSDDPMGQHNPLASQGPLDWSAVGDIEGEYRLSLDLDYGRTSNAGETLLSEPGA